MGTPHKQAQDTYNNIRGAVGPAYREAANSGLPGLHNGPADAYRHIMGAAEITQRYGEATARIVLEGHELDGLIRSGQPWNELEMDRHNNAIGIAIGREAGTFDEVIERAREKIDSATQRAKGETMPRWLSEGEWKGGGANWPPEWKEPKAGDYEFGGEEHRYPSRKDESAPEDVHDILGQPMETWSEEDVLVLQGADAYRNSWDPAFAETHALVGRWYDHFYGNGPVPRDATGRMMDLKPIRPIPPGHGGLVHVRAHARMGEKISVHAYDRARPA